METPAALPKLRLVDAQPYHENGTEYLLLRDPLALSDQTLLIPQAYWPLLALLDGSHSLTDLRGILTLRYGVLLSTLQIKQIVAALDEACLLDTPRAETARAAAVSQFRAAPHRSPSHGGAAYAAGPADLRSQLQAYLDAAPVTPLDNPIRGILSPHIDYARGGNVYAQVWRAAQNAVQAAELVVILGTDHFSEGFPFSLTRQSYATPYGTLPTSSEWLDRFAQAVGTEAAFRGELHHRSEHSIELAAVWLHHMRARRPVTLLPILVGPLRLEDNAVQRAVDLLRQIAALPHTLIVAAGDLAHVGPAFDTEPLDDARRAALRAADDQLLGHLAQGDAAGFWGAVQQVEDANNVCGLGPITLTVSALAPTQGRLFGYDTCPADDEHTSAVTVAGMLWE